jgi:hypothetical protein
LTGIFPANAIRKVLHDETSAGLRTATDRLHSIKRSAGETSRFQRIEPWTCVSTSAPAGASRACRALKPGTPGPQPIAAEPWTVVAGWGTTCPPLPALAARLPLCAPMTTHPDTGVAAPRAARIADFIAPAFAAGLIYTGAALLFATAPRFVNLRHVPDGVWVVVVVFFAATAAFLANVFVAAWIVRQHVRVPIRRMARRVWRPVLIALATATVTIAGTMYLFIFNRSANARTPEALLVPALVAVAGIATGAIREMSIRQVSRALGLPMSPDRGRLRAAETALVLVLTAVLASHLAGLADLFRSARDLDRTVIATLLSVLGVTIVFIACARAAGLQIPPPPAFASAAAPGGMADAGEQAE